jgi:hypothetical protein
MSFNAASALRRSSFAEVCAPAGLEAVVCEGVGLACCAQVPTGIASSADAAIAVAQLAGERFIAWLLPEQMLKIFTAEELSNRSATASSTGHHLELIELIANDLLSGCV